MKLTDIDDLMFKPAFSLLPVKMDSPEAKAMLLAIALQESRFQHRIQLIGTSRRWWESLKGPARGFEQFELFGGTRGVLRHHTTRGYADHVLTQLRYPNKPRVVWMALAHNDTLAMCMARLLLWTHPNALPSLDGGWRPAWEYYLSLWRPGKPHIETWEQFWLTAIEVVETWTPTRA